jgi:glutamate synthase (NADPH/NADH) large chain
MTGGIVVVLGEVGDNFGAGFTGGMAFVYDREKKFELRLNPETLHWQRVSSVYWAEVLKGLVERHVAETESRYAAILLNDWNREFEHFWQVVPKEYIKYLAAPLTDEAQAASA